MSKKNSIGETPLMRQYNSLKSRYPDAILLFRVGDFYETFGEDAVKTSSVLGIVLTKRANGAAAFIDLAGFPYHSLDNYLPKLVRAGYRVAICDQLEDPKLAKTIVKRGVTEMVTPGISYNDKVIDHNKNNYLASVHFGNNAFGVSFVDISTGEFLVAQGNKDYIDKLLQSLKPSEVVFQKNRKPDFITQFGDGFFTYHFDEWVFQSDYAQQLLTRHFGTVSLKGFGIEHLDLAIVSAGAILHYLSETQIDKLGHISSISRIDEDKFVWLDRFTIKNLELIHATNENGKSLTDIIDKTITPMGARMLKRWVLMPLRDKISIEERHEVVMSLLQDQDMSHQMDKILKQVGDLERLISKVALAKIAPRELLQLNRALGAITPIKALCSQSGNRQLAFLADRLNPCELIRDRIEKEIDPNAPALAIKGGVMAPGVSSELDDLRQIAYSGKDYLLRLQQREIENTGITSLKVSFNNVFGYYIEVTHTHKDKVPDSWVRKQTLVNAERYITAELKEYEEKILGAEDKILSLEHKLYAELIICVSEYIEPIQANAVLLAKLDCLLAFAVLAREFDYVKPHISDGKILDIKNGRHPVIERCLPLGEVYVPNDVYLDPEHQQIIIITGPNMAGKSALLRQTALIVLLAQMGCFVPAKSAEIGLVDKIYTRVGASDNISSGESTFMVEMNETSSILNNLSERSLILLDEIGRGTSTYDGISIAWSIVEYLHNHSTYNPVTLFATHYHELNELADYLPRVRNFNVSVKESGNKVIFIRKLVPGGSEHSFGIHVARMAGMPVKVVRRAEEILVDLEKTNRKPEKHNKNQMARAQDNLQLSIFQLDDPVLEQIKEEVLKTDIDSLTPVEALIKLNDIKKLMGK